MPNYRLTFHDVRPFGLLLFLLLGASLVLAQDKVQMVTKKLEQSFSYQKGMELNIQAEKAQVELRAWDRQIIKVELALITRHPERGQAEAALDWVYYDIALRGQLLYLANGLESRPEPPPAPVSAQYLIHLPRECPVFIKNEYGAIDISDLISELQIDGEFCKISLDNLKGTLIIDTYYGDIEGRRLEGNIHIESRHGNITLREMKGNFDIKASYALIRLYADEELAGLMVDADKSDVELYHPDLTGARHYLAVSNGQLHIPQQFNLRYLENRNDQIRARYSPQRELTGANIRITISYGDLRLGN